MANIRQIWSLNMTRNNTYVRLPDWLGYFDNHACLCLFFFQLFSTHFQTQKYLILKLTFKYVVVLTIQATVGSGCGSVGRTVASDTRDPRFESSHRQKFVNCQLCIEKTKIKKKRPGMAHLKKTIWATVVAQLADWSLPIHTGLQSKTSHQCNRPQLYTLFD